MLFFSQDCMSDILGREVEAAKRPIYHTNNMIT
jgi:hypothetical protein